MCEVTLMCLYITGDPSERKVPESLVEAAASVRKSKVQCSHGPSDAVAAPASDEEDEEEMNENEPMNSDQDGQGLLTLRFWKRRLKVTQFCRNGIKLYAIRVLWKDSHKRQLNRTTHRAGWISKDPNYKSLKLLVKLRTA